MEATHLLIKLIKISTCKLQTRWQNMFEIFCVWLHSYNTQVENQNGSQDGHQDGCQDGRSNDNSFTSDDKKRRQILRKILTECSERASKCSVKQKARKVNMECKEHLSRIGTYLIPNWKTFFVLTRAQYVHFF